METRIPIRLQKIGRTEYNDRQVDIIDSSYPQLDMCDYFLTYDWIERADEVGETILK